MLRFDLARLRLTGTVKARDAGNWPPLPAPVGTDGDPGNDRRIVRAPDESVVATFARPASGAVWRGNVTAANGRPAIRQKLDIDDGSTRENGAALALACLLPRGEGAIMTYLGPPADRYSEFVGAGRKAQRLSAPYVMTCVMGSR